MNIPLSIGRPCPNKPTCLFRKLIQAKLDPETFNCVFYESGETIFEQREAVAGCYLICQGWVKEFYRTPLGNKRILRLVGPQGVLAAEKVLLRKTWHDTAALVCTDAYVIILLSNGGFQNLWDQNEWTRLLSSRLAETVESLKKTHERTCYSVRARLADMLLHLERKGLLSKMRLTNEDLGELVGCTQVAISNTISEFKEKRVVKREGRALKIVDEQGLESYMAD